TANCITSSTMAFGLRECRHAAGHTRRDQRDRSSCALSGVCPRSVMTTSRTWNKVIHCIAQICGKYKKSSDFWKAATPSPRTKLTNIIEENIECLRKARLLH